jgi:hypothetical protein
MITFIDSDDVSEQGRAEDYNRARTTPGSNSAATDRNKRRFLWIPILFSIFFSFFFIDQLAQTVTFNALRCSQVGFESSTVDDASLFY